MKMMEVFSNRLKELRNELPLEKRKQTDVAKELGISAQSYSTYENGREPNYELLCKISKYFNVSIDYLLGQTTTKNKEEKELTHWKMLFIESYRKALENSEFDDNTMLNFTSNIYETAFLLKNDPKALKTYKNALLEIGAHINFSVLCTYGTENEFEKFSDLILSEYENNMSRNKVLPEINKKEYLCMVEIGNIFEIFLDKAKTLAPKYGYKEIIGTIINTENDNEEESNT